MADGFFSRLGAALQSLRGTTMPEQKDIWGADWRSFMGIDSGSSGGIHEINDQPADYERSRTAESYVYRCVDIRGKSISQVPLCLWQTDKSDKRTKIDGHPAQELIALTNPLGYVAGTSKLMRFTLASTDLHGRSAWKLAFNGRGVPTEIYWQVPTQFEPLHGFDKMDPSIPFWGIRSRAQQTSTDVPAQDIVYFTSDNFADPIMGTSKIQVLKNSINLRAYSQKSNIDFFKNSMRPDWILSGDWQNTEDNIGRIRRELRRHFAGESNRQPLILGGGATAHLLTTQQKDSEWLAQMRLSQEEISMAFGVPVMYLNNFDRAIQDNVKTSKLILWHDTMIPEGDDLAEQLTRNFLWRFWPDTQRKGITFGFDYSAIEGLGEDLALVWERFMAFMRELDNQVQRQMLTPNQARQALEQLAGELGVDAAPWKGDVPGGDTFYVNGGMLPIEEANLQGQLDLKVAGSYSPQLELVQDTTGAPTIAEDATKPNPAAQAGTGDATTTAPPQEPPTQEPPKPPKKPKKRKAVFKAPHPIPIRDRRLAPIQQRTVRGLKRFFQGLQSDSLRSLRKGHDDAETKDANINADDLYDREKAKQDLLDLLKESITDAGEQAYDASAEDFGLSVSWSVQNPWLADYMGVRLSMIHDIEANTADALRDTLLEGSQAGESVPQLATRVSGVFKDAIDNRAETIARTELIQAYGAASVQSYRDAGLETATMYDGDGDEACADMDGQVLSLDDAEQAMADEHPNGTRGMAPNVDLPGQTVEAMALGPGIRMIA